MAVGSLPVAAIAEGTSVETQAASDQTNFQNGTVSFSVDGAADDDAKITYDGEEHSIAPLSILVQSGQSTVSLGLSALDDVRPDGSNYMDQDGNLYIVSYSSNVSVGENGNYSVKDAGTYTVSITATSGVYAGATNNATFTVEKRSVEGATAANVTYDSTTLEDEIEFTVDGVRVDSYTVNWVQQKADDGHWNHIGNSLNAIQYAGTYQVNITGTGSFKDTATIDVTVDKLDLSKLDNSDFRIGKDLTSYSAEYVTDNLTVRVNDQDIPASALGIKLSDAGAAVADHVYTYEVGAVDEDNVTGKGTRFTTTQTTYYVNNDDVKYIENGNVHNSDDQTYIDLDSDQKFDASNIKVRISGTVDGYTTQYGSQAVLTSDIYDVTYEKLDEDGNWVAATEADLANGGDYRASVKVNAEKAGYKIQGGTYDGHYLYFHVYHSKAATIYVSYKGQQLGHDTDRQSGIWPTYDGTDRKGDFSIIVKQGDKTLVEGTDYKVEYFKVDSNNASVETATDTITDAGQYRIRVTLLNGYHNAKIGDVTSAVVPYNTVDTTNVFVKAKEVNATVTKGNRDNNTYYVHTGSAITPAITFTDANGDEVEVPADQYTVEYFKNNGNSSDQFSKVDSIVDAGRYNVSVTTKQGANYVINQTDASDTIVVKDARRFEDVPESIWYATVVNKAADEGFINGYSGSNLFGPERSITRADVACVLFNVAQAKNQLSANEENSYTTDGGYNAGFSDVDGGAYYAKAIAWAKKAGIVNGYGDDTFRPEQNVTREEFASMLANYAKQTGDYAAGSASDIASFDDASSVSDWALENVAWAVNAGVIHGYDGKVIGPQFNITRAEAAAMVVNYFVD